MALVNVFLGMGIICLSTAMICMWQHMSNGVQLRPAFNDVQDAFWPGVGFTALAIIGLFFV